MAKASKKAAPPKGGTAKSRSRKPVGSSSALPVPHSPDKANLHGSDFSPNADGPTCTFEKDESDYAQ